MSSKRIRGVLFQVFPRDHLPMHAHARFAGLEVIVEFDEFGNLWLARRHDPISPSNASPATVRKILRIASEHVADLLDLWERMR